MSSTQYNKKWTNLEKEYLQIYYPSHGVKYCSINLKRTPRACSEQAKKMNIKVSYETKIKLISKYTKEILEEAVINSKCYSDVIRFVGIIPQAGNFKNIKKHIENFKIDTSHFLSPGELTKLRNRNGFKNNQKKPIEEYLVANLKVDGRRLKDGLFEAGYKERKCERCNQGEEWQGEKLILIIDHKNGNHFDNRLENLRILCPNCNSLLPTHCSKNRQINLKKLTKCINCDNHIKFKSKTGYCHKCVKEKCRKVIRPLLETILQDLKDSNFISVGKKYGVSDNCIRKWIKQYEKNASVGEWSNSEDS